MFTEKSPLHPGQGPQAYVFTSPQRMYKKKVKQLQCYFCGIVLALFSLALLCAILFSVDEEEFIDNGGNATDPVLYMAQPNGDPHSALTLGKSDDSKDLIKKLYTSGTVTGGKVTAQLDNGPPVDLFNGILPATIYLDTIKDPMAWGSSSQIKWSGVAEGNSIAGTFSLPAKIGNDTKIWKGNFSLDLTFKWMGNLDMIEPKKLYDCKVLFINYKKATSPKDVLKGKTATDEETCSLLLSGSFYEPSFFCYITPWWCTKEELFYWDGGVELKVTKPLPKPANSTVTPKQILGASQSETKVAGSVTWGTVNITDSLTGMKSQVWNGVFPADIDLSIFSTSTDKKNSSYPLTISWSATVSESGLQGSFKLPRTMNGVNGGMKGDFKFQINSTELSDKLIDGATYESPIYLHENIGPNYQAMSQGGGDKISIVILGKHVGNSFSWNGQFVIIFSESKAQLPLSKFVLGAGGKTSRTKILGSVTSGWLRVTDSGVKKQVWNGIVPANIDLSIFATSKTAAGSYPLIASWSSSVFQSTIEGSFKLPNSANINGQIDGDFLLQVKSLGASLADMVIPGVTYESPIYLHDSRGQNFSTIFPFTTPGVGSPGDKLSITLLGTRSGNVFSWDGQFILTFQPTVENVPVESNLNLKSIGYSPETKIAGSVSSGWLTMTDSITGLKNMVWNGDVPANVSLSLFTSMKTVGTYPLRINWTCSIFHSAIKGSFKLPNNGVNGWIDGDFSIQVNSYGASLAGFIIPGVTYESPVYLHDSHGQNFSALVPNNPSDGTPSDKIALVLLGKRSSKNFSWNGQFVIVFSSSPIQNEPTLQASRILKSVGAVKTLKKTKIVGSVSSGWLTVADSVSGNKIQIWNGDIPQDISLSVFSTSKINGSYPLTASWSCSVFHSTMKGSFKYPRSMNGINGWINGDFMFQVNANAGLADLVIPGVTYESPIYLHDSNVQNFSVIPSYVTENKPGDEIAIVLLGKRNGNSFSWDGQFIVVISEATSEDSVPSQLLQSSPSRINVIPSIIADWKLGSKVLGKATSGWLSVVSDAGASQTVWNGEIPANITLPVFWTSDSSMANASSLYSHGIVWSCSVFQSSVRGSFKLPQHTNGGLVKWVRGEFYVQLKPNPDWSFYDVFTPGINYNSPIHYRDSASLDMDSLLVPYRAHQEPDSQVNGIKAPVILLGRRTKTMFSWNGSFIALVGAAGQ